MSDGYKPKTKFLVRTLRNGKENILPNIEVFANHPGFRELPDPKPDFKPVENKPTK